MELFIMILKILFVIWFMVSAINILFVILLTFECNNRFKDRYQELYKFTKEHKEKCKSNAVITFVKFIQNVLLIICPILHFNIFYMLVFDFENTVNELLLITVKNVRFAFNKYNREQEME